MFVATFKSYLYLNVCVIAKDIVAIDPFSMLAANQIYKSNKIL